MPPPSIDRFRLPAIVLSLFLAVLVSKAEQEISVTAPSQPSTPGLDGSDSATTSNLTLILHQELDRLIMEPEPTESDIGQMTPDVTFPGHERWLTERALVRFLTKAPEQPFGWATIPDTPERMIRNRRRWTRIHTDAEVAEGRRRNHLARITLLRVLQSRDRTLPESRQMDVLHAACEVWIWPDEFRAGPSAAVRRREEDEIPSAETVLLWFVDNDSFCDAVRDKARTLLETLATTKGR